MVTCIYSREYSMNRTRRETELILRAIVSLCFRMARTQTIGPEQIEAVGRLLRSALGEEPSLQMLGDIARDPLSIRQATALLKSRLTDADKFKLLLNLFFLGYMENRFQVLSSLEIIQIVDLLCLDVRLYDGLLDLLEGSGDHLDHPANPFLAERPTRLLCNDMLLGSDPLADVRIRRGALVTITVMEHVLVSAVKGGEWLLDGDPMLPDRFVQLDERTRLTRVGDPALELTRDDLLQLDGLRLAGVSRATRIRSGAVVFDIVRQGAAATVQPVQKAPELGGRKVRPGTALALDDRIVADDVFAGLDLLLDRVEGDRAPAIAAATGLEEDERRVVGSLSVREIHHEFTRGQKVALDNLHFVLNSGEMLAIMGPSGSGKTTLLKCLLGDIAPTRIRAEIDGKPFFPAASELRRLIGYVPQDDLLFENLTVRENLYYCARVRMPRWTDRKRIDARIDHILGLMGLTAKANLPVGDVMRKTLSGGERRRLNIALELLADPAIIILDEPTSGLSSKDSENLIEVLDELKRRGKIIIATIHQPNSDIFQRFDRLLLLDSGGVQAYFGATAAVFDYFDEELSQAIEDQDVLSRKKQLRSPDYFFDLLEYRESRSPRGERRRKYPPAHWKEKYRRNRLLEMLQDPIDEGEEFPARMESQAAASRTPVAERLRQWGYLFLRNARNKLSNRLNLVITLGASPLLGVIIAFILRNQPPGQCYSVRNNNNIGLFIFISVIVFLFLGMANSIHEIIAERRVIARERKLGLRSTDYLGVKTIALGLISLLQALLYLAPGLAILHVRGMSLWYLAYFFLAGWTGSAIGLVCSAWLRDREAATNLMPYLLIPQILFAGAVIQFKDMNPALKLDRNAGAPEFCDVFPSRWLFEGLAVAQVKHNLWLRKVGDYYERIAQAPDPAARDQLMIECNEWTTNNDRTAFRNALLEDWVSSQDNRLKETGRNQFMASTRRWAGREVDAAGFDAAVLLLMIAGMTALSGFLLERSTR
jgi:ABC-type multidrug transport system ATPase subunit